MHIRWLLGVFAALIQADAASAVPYSANGYLDERIEKNCSSSSGYSCTITFTSTQAGRFTTFRRVSCFINTAQPIRTILFGALVGSLDRYVMLPFAANSTGNGRYYYNLNETVEIKLPGGPTPYLYVGADSPGSIYMNCTVTGQQTSQ